MDDLPCVAMLYPIAGEITWPKSFPKAGNAAGAGCRAKRPHGWSEQRELARLILNFDPGASGSRCLTLTRLSPSRGVCHVNQAQQLA